MTDARQGVARIRIIPANASNVAQVDAASRPMPTPAAPIEARLRRLADARRRPDAAGVARRSAQAGSFPAIQ
jgi:hypothetical protein